jgi:hypothetical protein
MRRSARDRQGCAPAPRGVEAPLRFAAPCVEVVLVLLESARAEERAQERLPLLSRREEEPGELVLREQDHLLELLSSEPEHLAEGEADIARLSGAPDPHAVDELLELGAGRSVVRPPPRFAGRSYSGARVTRQRASPTVNSRRTSVGSVRKQWSLRSLFSPPS